MPNEFIARNGVIAQNNSTISGSLSVTSGITGSFQGIATTASYVLNAVSSSFATSAVTSSFANAFTVAGTLTAQTLVVQTVTSSVSFITGSTRFGSLAANTHVFTGSMSVTGSVTATSFAGSGANLTSIPNAALSNSTISGIALGSNLATLTISTGLSGTSYNGSGAVTITNTGVTSNVAGTGISVSGATGAVTITNSGVTSIVAGTNISISGATGAVTITNGVTNNNQLTNGAGYITGITSGNVTTALGFTPYNATNPSGYITSAGNAATATTAANVASPDGDRNPSTKLPTTNARNVRFDFSGAGAVGGTGNYAGVMTYAPWDGTSASTGDSSYQLAFLNETGVNASGVPGLSLRNGINSTWNAWYRIITSGNIGSQTVASAGNATTAGGLAVHTGRNNEANKIVRTQENGYVFFGYINSTSGNENNNSNADRVWGTNGSDDYLRTYRTSALSVSYAATAGTAGGQNSGAHFTLNTGGAGYGLVGVYNPNIHQGFFAMGAAYTLSAGGGLANFYGASWTYDGAGYPLNTGYAIQHCIAVANAGTVYSLIGVGIWTSGLIRTNSYISAGGAITTATTITAGSGTPSTFGSLTLYGSDFGGGYFGRAESRNSDGNFWLSTRTNSGTYFDNIMMNSGGVTVYGSFVNSSDIRFKTNIETIPNALSKVLEMRGVTFNRIERPEDPKEFGFIAQELLPIIPEVVHKNYKEIGNTEDFTYSVSYVTICALLTESIKELNAKIEELSSQNESLQSQINELKNN
jgi:hypothetical protein